jgi:diaminopimelate dehydrogenase
VNNTATTSAPSIRLGIVGYGNLGRGVEQAITQNPDLSLVAVFTRRDPGSLTLETPNIPVVALDDIATWKDRIDVMILCGGSATDLPQQTPQIARLFTCVDSFDTHAKIPAYYREVHHAALMGIRIAIISVGWDPGLFSLNRLYAEAILPEGETTTFWGPGISQGHSDAIRRIPGVADARQYTIPMESAVQAARDGNAGALTTREKHLRECWVVLEDGADADAVKQAIVTMPDYFADYDTSVNFISAEELAANHAAMPHGGFVIRRGGTRGDGGHGHVIEYTLKLESNPEFTAAVLVAYARAAHRLTQRGETGARTVFDIAPGLLSPLPDDALRATLL